MFEGPFVMFAKNVPRLIKYNYRVLKAGLEELQGVLTNVDIYNFQSRSTPKSRKN